MATREFVHGDKPGNELPAHDLVSAAERQEPAAKTGQDRTRGGKRETKLAEYRDALTGMAAQFQEFEKRIRRHEVEKAELAARITDLDQRNAVLNSYLQDAAAAGAALLDEVRRERDAERDCSVVLRKQLEASEQSVLESQQQRAGAARLEHALAAAEAAAAAAASESASLLAKIARRDAAVARLKEQLISKLEAEDAGLIPRLDSTTGRNSSSGEVTDGEAEWTGNGSLLVSLEGDKEVKHPLYKPVMVIGRSFEADIRVEGPHTSRRHARVFVSNGTVIIEDMVSLNGTIVNEQVVRRRELHDGDVLDIGGARLRFVKLGEKSAAPDAGTINRD